jgi:uncharacterized protein (TIGR02001 family)
MLQRKTEAIPTIRKGQPNRVLAASPTHPILRAFTACSHRYGERFAAVRGVEPGEIRMMKNMRTILSIAAASIALAGVAHAEETGPKFTGNVALATDYTFRGISQTNNGPAIQGGFDYTYDKFYAGVWASNIDFGLADGSTEVDLYAGFKPQLGPVGLDFGAIGYFYPNASDNLAELDYAEVYGKASFAPTEGATIGAALFYSPEFTGETGTGLYAELNGAFAINDTISVSGAYGYQKAEDADFQLDPGQQDDYQTWNIGGTVNAYGFAFDLRYVDTDIDDSVSIAKERVVFGIKRSF